LTTHLNPPATMVVCGHFSAAVLMCLVASAMAEAVVPAGVTLSIKPAEYAGLLTPWHATSLLKMDFSPLQRPGPTLLVVPYNKSVALQLLFSNQLTIFPVSVEALA
jgi:hypothetical protein